MNHNLSKQYHTFNLHQGQRWERRQWLNSRVHEFCNAMYWPGEDAFVLRLLFSDEADTHHDAAEVSQVKDVMRLGGRRKQVAHCHLVHLQRTTHHSIASSKEVRRKVESLQHSIARDWPSRATIRWYKLVRDLTQFVRFCHLRPIPYHIICMSVILFCASSVCI